MNIGRILTGTVFIAYGYYIISTDGARIGNRCIEDLSRSFTVQLQCPTGEWIHVVQETYGDGDTATCHLKSADACSKLRASSHNGLVVNCNGKQSCFEAMKVQPINNCNITDAVAEVKYNCIKGSMDMCSPVTTTVNGSVYLHSPGFPDSVGVMNRCVVRITGQVSLVTLVDQYMRSGKLKISGDGRQLWTNVYVGQYNRVLPGPAAEMIIVYDNQDQDGSNVWIRVAGSGQIDITIGGETMVSPTTSTSTLQPSLSQNTSGPDASDTARTVTTARAQSTTIGNRATQRLSKSTTMVSTTDAGNSGDIVIALSVVCGILVLIIVFLVIYFKVVKPFRKKHDASSYAGTFVAHGATNLYDGIQRNTSDASDEHSYGHITSSGGPVYANSVSGDDPYVNT